MCNILCWFSFVPYMLVLFKGVLSSLALDKTKFSFIAQLYSYQSVMNICNVNKVSCDNICDTLSVKISSVIIFVG